MKDEDKRMIGNHEVKIELDVSDNNELKKDVTLYYVDPFGIIKSRSTSVTLTPIPNEKLPLVIGDIRVNTPVTHESFEISNWLTSYRKPLLESIIDNQLFRDCSVDIIQSGCDIFETDRIIRFNAKTYRGNKYNDELVNLIKSVYGDNYEQIQISSYIDGDHEIVTLFWDDHDIINHYTLKYEHCMKSIVNKFASISTEYINGRDPGKKSAIMMNNALISKGVLYTSNNDIIITLDNPHIIIDIEMENLVKIINSISLIKSSFCCAGHEYGEYRPDMYIRGKCINKLRGEILNLYFNKSLRMESFNLEMEFSEDPWETTFTIRPIPDTFDRIVNLRGFNTAQRSFIEQLEEFFTGFKSIGV